MKRRSILALISLSVLWWPTAVEAQQLGDTTRVVLRAATDTMYQDWGLAKQSDPMDDSDRSVLLTLATSASTSETPMVMFRCEFDGLNFQYGWDSFFAGNDDGEVQVRYRVDSKAPSESVAWSLAGSDHDAAWMPMQLVPVFRREAEHGRKLVLRVVDSDGETKTHIFSLRGMSEGLKHLSCAQSDSE